MPFSLESTPTALQDLPPGSWVAHATNCVGVWGAGFAADLARLCPFAQGVYAAHCVRRMHDADLVGSMLVIPPQIADVALPGVTIVCLFTSRGYGRGSPAARRLGTTGPTGVVGGNPGRDTPARIVRQTRTALAALRDELARPGGPAGGEPVPHTIYSPQFNAGNFRVPWDQTAAVIWEVFAGWDWDGRWLVLPPPPPLDEDEDVPME